MCVTLIWILIKNVLREQGKPTNFLQPTWYIFYVVNLLRWHSKTQNSQVGAVDTSVLLWPCCSFQQDNGRPNMTIEGRYVVCVMSSAAFPSQNSFHLLFFRENIVRVIDWRHVQLKGTSWLSILSFIVSNLTIIESSIQEQSIVEWFEYQCGRWRYVSRMVHCWRPTFSHISLSIQSFHTYADSP